VIYPNRAVERADAPQYASLLKLPEVQRVYLEDFAGRPATTLGVRLIQLLIGDAQQAVSAAVVLLEQARTLPKAELTFEQILELVETILVYQCPQWGREEIKAMLGLQTELKQTRFYQEVFAEGRIEGRIEGEARGEARLLRKLLIRRFGALPEGVELRLQQAEPAQLELWGERVLEVKNLEDIFAGE
jgi:predicted transposase YdaD